MTMALSNFFGIKPKNDPTEGTVRRAVEARLRVEKASDRLTRALDMIDERADITIKGFLDETRQRRDKT
jgi:hypothetical protein